MKKRMKRQTNTCPRYAGKCTINAEFCAKRYHKAIHFRHDESLHLCRTCTRGRLDYNRLRTDIKFRRYRRLGQITFGE